MSPASKQPPSPIDEHLATQRQVMTMVRWLLYLVFVVIAYWVLQRLAPVLAPLLAAAGIAYLLDPLVEKLEASGMRRVVAVSLLITGFLGLLGGSVFILVPLVAEDLARFAASLPTMIAEVNQWLAGYGFEVPSRWEDYLQSDKLSAMLNDVAGPATTFAAAALGSVFGLLGTLAELLLVPVFAFYFLLDWHEIIDATRRMIPPRHRATSISVIAEIDRVVSGWIRGQFTIVCIQAVLYAACFHVIGIHLAISVGLLVGLLTIIPFLGTVVGAAITLVLVLLHWQGWVQLASVAAVFIVLHALEAAVLTPRIVGKRVGLGETGALFAVLAGGQLLGFTGVLLAVPIAASVAVLVRRLWRYYELSSFYGAADRDTSQPLPPEPLPRVAATVSLSPQPRSEGLSIASEKPLQLDDAPDSAAANADQAAEPADADADAPDDDDEQASDDGDARHDA
ncbi:AI-2E family transporter [Haliangium ochraceum]|uniref:AI-2E family transporter n=1 Tax=Haliangium ochraceum (strain DSM 14365 / JCM 11303 / SMP-2) TaxID=502025 RepID=D0LTW6_HALO1|nr:AI-2E family transporter [Haliangium ochraceum]ACY15810.1 protein of unknown function UPF0118 [Haliangium ochraceum DSM 14365]